MKITIVNNGSVPVPAPGAVTVPAGGSLTLTERTVEEYESMVQRFSSDDVQVHNELEVSDLPPLQCVMKNPADPAADATTLAGVGFDMKDLYGTAFSTTAKMYLGAFDDAACTIPSTTATLGTATTGTISAGEDTNVVEVNPVGGVFACSLDIPLAADQVVYLKAWAHPTNLRSLDTSGTDTVTFSVS